MPMIWLSVPACGHRLLLLALVREAAGRRVSSLPTGSDRERNSRVSSLLGCMEGTTWAGTAVHCWPLDTCRPGRKNRSFALAHVDQQLDWELSNAGCTAQLVFVALSLPNPADAK